MSENTTRIVDLPDNNHQVDNHMHHMHHSNQHSHDYSHQQPSYQQHHHMQNQSYSNKMSKMDQDEMNTTYIPMNIHPNPYGNNIQMEVLPHPEYNPPQNHKISNEIINIDIEPEHKQHLENMPKMRLPSRDIPMNQIAYQQDEEIKPNYIPKPKLTGDYVKEYEEAAEKSIKKQENKKIKEESLDDIFTSIQLPIFVAILFLFFELPIVNMIIFKYFKFLPIFHADGNINFYGILFKSISFGIIFFIIQKFTNFLLTV